MIKGGAIQVEEKKTGNASHPWRGRTLTKADRVINSKRGGVEPSTIRPMSNEAAKAALIRIGSLVTFLRCGEFDDEGHLLPKTGCGEYGGIMKIYNPSQMGFSKWCGKCGRKD